MPSVERAIRGRFTEFDELLKRTTPPQEAVLPTTEAELLSITELCEEVPLSCQTTNAPAPSEETFTTASTTSMLAAERVVTGPHEAKPPEIVAELVFTCLFPLADFSSHTAVALVPSLDTAIFNPVDCVPTVDKSTGVLKVGWAIALDEKQLAIKTQKRATRRIISVP